MKEQTPIEITADRIIRESFPNDTQIDIIAERIIREIFGKDYKEINDKN